MLSCLSNRFKFVLNESVLFKLQHYRGLDLVIMGKLSPTYEKARRSILEHHDSYRLAAYLNNFYNITVPSD